MREPERAITDRTRIFWFESPNNPHLRCVDVKRIAEACRARNVISVIDNTFASPITSGRSRWASIWRCRARPSTSTVTAT